MDPETSFPGDDFIIAENWEWDVYFHPSWKQAQLTTIIDVGAHIGAFALFCASQMHCNKIYAYEPFRENYDLLMMNIKSNDLGAKISASRKAIDGKTCKRRLYLDPRSNAGHSLVKESGRWNVVNCITLEELFSENQIEVVTSKA